MAWGRLEAPCTARNADEGEISAGGPVRVLDVLDQFPRCAADGWNPGQGPAAATKLGVPRPEEHTELRTSHRSDETNVLESERLGEEAPFRTNEQLFRISLEARAVSNTAVREKPTRGHCAP